MNKINKIITIIFLLAIAMSFFTSNVNAQPLLKASLSKYEPTPAEPGSYVTIYVKVENQGNGVAQNARLEIIPEFPFTLDNSDDAVKVIGILGAQKDYVADFKVRVSENAVPGENELKIRYIDDPTSGSWIENKLIIQVNIKGANLAIDSINVEPKEISPGSTAKINIALKNIADSFFKDISVNLNLAPVTTATSILYDQPFAPVGSGSEKRIPILERGKIQNVDFSIISYPTATLGVYKLPLIITYYDSLGTQHTKSDLIGIVINSEPVIEVSLDSSTIYSSKLTGEIVLKIINKGLGNIKFLDVTLKESSNYDILSTSNRKYIGSLDSDDFETAEFRVTLKDPEKAEFLIQLSYKDSNNNQYIKDGIVKLKLLTPEQAGTKKGNGFGIIIIVLIVLIVGFFIVKNIIRKKKDN
ncbi:MAG: COG1361 S-layer family protein [Candidatus Woesearchaeota archaeon]